MFISSLEGRKVYSQTGCGHWGAMAGFSPWIRRWLSSIQSLEMHETIQSRTSMSKSNCEKRLTLGHSRSLYGSVSQTVVRGPLGVREALTGGGREKMGKLLFSCRIYREKCVNFCIHSHLKIFS